MSKTKHTPGPWYFGGKNRSGNYLVANRKIDRNGGISSEGEFVCRDAYLADARLISAAPEMLEALKEAEEICNFTGYQKTALLRKIRAAIAKAEGRDDE